MCIKCGKHIENDESVYCNDCSMIRHKYDRAFAPFLYEGEIKESIMKFKFLGKAEFSHLYASSMWEYGGALLLNWDPDVIIPVPIHKSRLKKRGYNQAELIARDLSKIIKVKVNSKILIRTKKTKAQKQLGFRERFNNLKGAFSIRKNAKIPEKILLVDDIYTTGSTLDSIAEMLKNNGAKEVYCVCAAIGKDFRHTCV